MLLSGLVLLIVSIASTVVFATQLSAMNSGQRLPLLTGSYAVRPTVRITAYRAFGALCAGVGTVVFLGELWTGSVVYKEVTTGIVIAAVVGLPALALTLRHNAGLRGVESGS